MVKDTIKYMDESSKQLNNVVRTVRDNIHAARINAFYLVTARMLELGVDVKKSSKRFPDHAFEVDGNTTKCYLDNGTEDGLLICTLVEDTRCLDEGLEIEIICTFNY